ncbi:uncharacterized protein LAESUDRAFT_714945 [Laetiporus sulphureus 93-53]|uniref:Uncharacterized protein n=1 Tax=Laetiporus sulphureus 93-53 TaxID=1314785 RepID=A0A165DQR0_9APHY|nr:uncharacterized protein LAESUDRAFT_714945 [Laetiporus sulphureus 93-53]KZT05419.1 hypothetical protein LAESUDRAFT_714945 [Laetiporus sulphureus 93-53]
MEMLLDPLRELLSVLEGVGLPADKKCLVVVDWHLAIGTIARFTDWDNYDRSLLDRRLEIPENAPEEHRKRLEAYNKDYIRFSELQKRVLEDKLPSPSTFAKEAIADPKLDGKEVLLIQMPEPPVRPAPAQATAEIEEARDVPMEFPAIQRKLAASSSQ